jgi:hypothetical protein
MKKLKTKIKKKKIYKGSLWSRIPLVQVYRDIKNYRSWINVIANERENPNSKFRKFGMEHSWFYVVYLYVNLPEEDALLPENIKRLRLLEDLSPIHQYLDDDLGFAGCLVPEFSQFYDEDDNPTLTYAAIYRFSFNRLSLKWLISRTLFTIVGIWAILHFNLATNLFHLIKNLF